MQQRLLFDLTHKIKNKRSSARRAPAHGANGALALGTPHQRRAKGNEVRSEQHGFDTRVCLFKDAASAAC